MRSRRLSQINPRTMAQPSNGGVVARIAVDAFFPQDLRVTMASGIVFGGAADFSYVPGSSGLNDFFTMAGGLTFGGAASYGTTRAPLTMAGGLVFGGSAQANFNISTVMAGGIVFGGAAAFGTVRSPITMAGGIVFGGSAQANLNLTGGMAGGLIFGGAASFSLILSPVMSGGVSFGGAAESNLSLSVTMSGGTLFGGAADFSYVPNGPLNDFFTMAGGVLFGGTAEYGTDRFASMVGGVTWGGAADFGFVPGSVNDSFTMGGGVSFGGEALAEFIGITPASVSPDLGGVAAAFQHEALRQIYLRDLKRKRQPKSPVLTPKIIVKQPVKAVSVAPRKGTLTVLNTAKPVYRDEYRPDVAPITTDIDADATVSSVLGHEETNESWTVMAEVDLGVEVDHGEEAVVLEWFEPTAVHGDPDATGIMNPSDEELLLMLAHFTEDIYDEAS